MIVEIKIPEVGESISSGILVEWLKRDGDTVQADDQLFELETDKVTMQVQAEHAGRLSIEVEAGSEVAVNQVVGRIDTSAALTSSPTSPTSPTSTPGAPSAASTTGAVDQPRDDSAGKLSPAVRRLVAEHGLDPRDIAGSGPHGRLIKGDVLAHLGGEAGEGRAGQAGAVAPASSAPVPPAVSPQPVLGPEGQAHGRQTRTRISSLRRRLAERLVAAQQQAAILTTFNEVDMSAVIALRAEFRDAFSERHGVRLGFMSFFVKAVVEALRSVPALNAQIDGDEIVENHFYDIGVAVGTDRGLVVPVVRDADQRSFAAIELAIADLARRAHGKQLRLDELTGGCFTISNGGVYGSLLSTPILNPPQSGILGLHAIKKRPVVVGDELVIRPMMYLAVSYDHRLVDGEQAVTFLRRIVERIERPSRLMLEV